MEILSQETFKVCDNVVRISKDYDLNNKRIEIPRDIIIDLSHGSLNNGTIIFKNNLLVNAERHAINAKVEGVIANHTIKTSWFADINQVYLIYNCQTVVFDEDTTITTPIVVNGDNVTYDGNGHVFSCQSSFFIISGHSNITIRNFNASATTPTDKFFMNMTQSNIDMSHINILNNHINNFQVGVSVSNENSNHVASHCLIYDNYIENCKGTNSGQGYGIHLANAEFCNIINNHIENCDRHAIYNAYGKFNRISGNTIKDHRKDVSDTGSVLPALSIDRKSEHIIIDNNRFINNRNVSILLICYSEGINNVDLTQAKYGNMVDITIRDNHFLEMTELEGTTIYPVIMVDYNAISPSSYTSLSTVYNIIDVSIYGNKFEFLSTKLARAIRVYRCENLCITNNEFYFKNIQKLGITNFCFLLDIDPLYNTINKMYANISQNIFSSLVSTVGTANMYCFCNMMNHQNSWYYITVCQNLFFRINEGSSSLYKLYYDQEYWPSALPSNLKLQLV